MASRELQGWQPDPFGLHEMRYFSVGQPTKLVRDGRVDTYDEPPGDKSSPGADTSARAVAVAADQATGAGAGVSTAALSAAALPAPAQSSAAQSAAGLPENTISTTAMPRQADPAAATRVFAPVQVGPTVGQAPRSPVARPQRRWMEYTFVAAGAVVAVLVFVLLAGGGRGKSGMTPAAFVTRAAQRTMAESTADFSLSTTASVSGHTLAITGNGQIDLANGSMSLSAAATTAGVSIDENVLEVGGNSYLKVAVNGHGLPLGSGRQWIETPFTAASAGSFATTSPESTLALLSQQGARVTSLGSRSIGGQSCTGYSVIPTSQAMAAGYKQEFARIGLSTSDSNAALQDLANVQPPTITAWFSTETNLTCQVAVEMQFGAPTTSGSGSVEAQLTFTHYGTPVNITAPPASDTVDLEQYLHGTSPV